MRKIYNLFLLIFFLQTGCHSAQTETVKVKLNQKTYKFEIADTPKERARGLMYRKKLNPNGGMLFIFSQMQYLSFYMKNTLIQLDIAFINNEFEIIDIQEMQPLDESDIRSKGPAQYALEVNRGFFKKNGIKVGDKIEILTPLPLNLKF